MPRSAAAAETALLAAGFAVLFLLLPHALAGDDYTRFSDVENLLHHASLSDSEYSLVGPIASAPFLLAGGLVESPEWWAARFNVIVVAAGALLAFRLLRGRADESLLRRALLVLLFESLLTNRLRDYGAEVFTGTLVALGIVCLALRRHVVLGWAAIVIGVVNTPAAGAGLAVLCAYELVRTRRLRALAPLAAAALLIMGESWLRRGGPLTTGYEGNHGVATMLPYSGRPGFSYPFLLGLLSILFSFGRGLLFFTPGLTLWLEGRTRALAAARRRALVPMLLFVGGLVLVYAKWWAWYGGLTWGPRFFLFAAFPASALVALRLRRPDPLALLVLALSAWVGLAGAIDDYSTLSTCGAGNYQHEYLCWYVPEFSPLWHPLVHFPHLTARLWALTAWFALVFVYLVYSSVRARASVDEPRRARRSEVRVP